MNWTIVLSHLQQRLREPSTYAALTGLLILLGINLDPGTAKDVTDAGTGIAALLGVILKEKAAHTTTVTETTTVQVAVPATDPLANKDKP